MLIAAAYSRALRAAAQKARAQQAQNPNPSGSASAKQPSQGASPASKTQH